MKPYCILAAIALGAAVPASEPPARPAASLPLPIAAPLAHVSAARELPDGRVILTDARTPAVWVLDPATGRRTPLGSPGAGQGQWVRPGGLYAGRDNETLLLDRAQARVTVLSPDGAFIRAYSVAVKGTTSSYDDDDDHQRIDARGFAYFPDRRMTTGGARGAGWPLLRFDPALQQSVPMAELRQPEARVIDMGNGLRISRGVIGSPADGWGVAPDGRVAVVRADPYGVDWISPEGTVTRGPRLSHDPVPMAEQDRKAYLDMVSRRSPVSVSRQGETGGAPRPDVQFADRKPPFAPEDVVVSPDAQVWVKRSRPAGSPDDIFDVFDSRARRMARLSFPRHSRLVGFGRGSVYVWHEGTLKRFQRPRGTDGERHR